LRAEEIRVLKEYKSGGTLRWVDLYNPTREEIAKACGDYQLNIPPRDQLEEIEFSSRLQYEDGVFTISVPVTPHKKPGEGEDETSPLGFVLTKDLLVTIRFASGPLMISALSVAFSLIPWAVLSFGIVC
jgi:magnesium transporter